jgi:hypothetical protein
LLETFIIYIAKIFKQKYKNILPAMWNCVRKNIFLEICTDFSMEELNVYIQKQKQ